MKRRKDRKDTASRGKELALAADGDPYRRRVRQAGAGRLVVTVGPAGLLVLC